MSIDIMFRFFTASTNCLYFTLLSFDLLSIHFFSLITYYSPSFFLATFLFLYNIKIISGIKVSNLAKGN